MKHRNGGALCDAGVQRRSRYSAYHRSGAGGSIKQNKTSASYARIMRWRHGNISASVSAIVAA